MARTVDHIERKDKILAAIVSTYIKSGTPVSSQELTLAFGLSSATMRNIMAELEKDGYLFQPHTSSGRIPTDKGYRYYVDFLMGQAQLPTEYQTAINEEYRKRIDSLEEILEKTTQIVATLTHYTALVSFSQWHDRLLYAGLSNIIKEPEFHDSKRMFVLIKMLEEKRQLLDLLNQDLSQSSKVYIGEELHCPNISDACSLIVSSYPNPKKKKQGKKEKGKIAVLGPRRMSYDKAVSTLEFVSEKLSDLLDEF